VSLLSESSKTFLGVGWKFPVQNDANLMISVSKYEQDIREAILIILGTSKGERIMRPDFGCGIHDFVFGSIDASTLGRIDSSVREALITWEPRINLLDVTISTNQIDEGKLIINITYEVRSTNNQFNLVYPFYLSEGG
jgi:uncharacterized protein